MVREKMLFLVLIAFVLAPVSASFAQHSDPMRRIGVFMYLKQNDPESQSYLTAFREGLQKAGWIVGRNLEIEYRWTGGDPQLTRKYAAELVALNPHVILTAGGAQVGPLQEVTRSIPIVFVQVADAVGRASSTAWRNRAATQPDSPMANSTLARSGSKCSNRSHRASSASRFCAIQPIPARRPSLVPFKQWLRLLVSRRALSACTTQLRSSMA